MHPATISDGVVVAFHYVLFGPDGEQLDDSRGRERPMLHLQGAKNIVRGLERQMPGKAVGDRFRVTVAPEDAYGVREGEPMPVPRDAFPDDAPMAPGGQFMTRTPDGRPMALWITRVEGDQVWVDPHHPLAGKTLTFDVEIIGLRNGTKAERESGRPEFGVDDA